jgi:geranylgeranyl diphosphate synthase type II
MLINALNRSNEEQRKILAEWIEKQEFNANEKIAAVTRIYDEIDIKTICTEKIDSLFAQSLANLEKVHVAESKKSTLKEFAINLMGRKH